MALTGESTSSGSLIASSAPFLDGETISSGSLFASSAPWMVGESITTGSLEASKIGINEQVYILDRDLNIIGLLDNYEYFSWTRKWRKPHSFELVINRYFSGAELLKPENYIAYRKGDIVRAGEILQRKIEVNEEGKASENWHVAGKGFGGLFEKRIAFHDTGYGSELPLIWQPETAYYVDDIIRPPEPNGCVYICTEAGTSSANDVDWDEKEIGRKVYDGDWTGDTQLVAENNWNFGGLITLTYQGVDEYPPEIINVKGSVDGVLSGGNYPQETEDGDDWYLNYNGADWGIVPLENGDNLTTVNQDLTIDYKYVSSGDPITWEVHKNGYDEITDKEETVMHHYVDVNLVNPNDSNREERLLELGTDKARGDTISFRARFQKIAKILESISLSSGFGWETRLDLEAKLFYFHVLEGRDKTGLIFSPNFDNVSLIGYQESISEDEKVIMIAGPGEGAGRELYEYNN